MQYEFDSEKRKEVHTGVAQHLGADKPLRRPEDGSVPERRVARMKLCRRDERGHEDPLLEWNQEELFGKGVAMEDIVTSIGIAACRDAAYQYGSEALYVLVFLGRENQNRSKFYFKLPAGQEINQMVLSGGPGSREAARGESLGVADLLRYVQAKEERIDKKQETFVDSLIRDRDRFAAVAHEYTDREMRIREIELGAEDRLYDREKKRRDDEETAAMKRDAWKLVKDNAPRLVPYVVAAVQRLSRGPQQRRPMQAAPRAPQPGAPGTDPGFDAWYAGASAGAGAGAGPWNVDPSVGQAPPSPGAQNGWYGGHGGSENFVSPEPQGPEANGAEVSAPPEALSIEALQLRVVEGAVGFITMVEQGGEAAADAVVGALSDAQRSLFGRVAEMPRTAPPPGPALEEAANLVLAFGLSVRADPASGMRLLTACGPEAQRALVELSQLLEEYALRTAASGQ
jgi:hypothetical protein